ncbi:MAG: hypothetical protein HQL48_03630 [Gammaproteobacteria bacterium]|nr:hypothetical protein [Gammaproteobacteria bacterium]
MPQTRLYSPLLLLLIFSIGGCGSGDDEADSGSSSTTPTLTSLWESSFSGCGLNCHSASAADSTENGPNLTTKSSFYSSLVNRQASDYPNWLKNGNCDQVKFITPGDAANSSLLASLDQGYADTLGATYNCTPSINLHRAISVSLSAANRDNLVTWINSGAMNN